MMRALVFVLAFVAIPATAMATGEEEYAFRRQLLILEIEDSVRDTSGYIGKAKLDDRVMAAMAKVPRHEFVPDGERAYAYENRPVPIGYGQTISQPYIVALMTDMLALGEDATVLEIGTGSAYQAAVLAELVERVYTIEIVEPLGLAARQRLAHLGYDNVETRIADGYFGWPEHAPFDSIMVTAAASHVPPPLIQQLSPGGHMVIPVGDRFFTQQLILIEKRYDGNISTTVVLPVRFVPLVRAE